MILHRGRIHPRSEATAPPESEVLNASPALGDFHYFYKGANHSDSPHYTRPFTRGQLLVNYEDIQEALSWRVGWRREKYSRNQVEAALKWLRKAAVITRGRHTRNSRNCQRYDVSRRPATTHARMRGACRHENATESHMINKKEKQLQGMTTKSTVSHGGFASGRKTISTTGERCG